MHANGDEEHGIPKNEEKKPWDGVERRFDTVRADRYERYGVCDRNKTPCSLVRDNG